MGYDPNWNCYPITSRPIGEESTREINHTKNRTVTLQVGDQTITLSERKRTYHERYYRKFMFSDPVVEALDGSVNEGGTSIVTNTGNISESYEWLDTTIIYLDLRYGIIVYRETKGNVAFAQSGTEPIGACLIDDGVGLQGHVTRDTIGLNCTHYRNGQVSEKLIIKTPTVTKTIDLSNSSTMVTMRLGITDYSGWCGGLSYICLPWRTYAVVDESQPHPSRNDYVPLYDIDLGAYPIVYYPPWCQIAEHTDIDTNDASLFNTYYGTNSYGSVPIAIECHSEPFPQASCAVDKDGNVFTSWLTEESLTYNVIINRDGSEENPVTISAITGDNPVFYPIAPA